MARNKKQVTGIPSHKKYENDGGPGIEKIMEVLTKSDDPIKDKSNFLKSQLVFWLLAGIDGHAKNFSVFLVPGGISLTPLYDVVSAHPPIKKKEISLQKAKLAMAVGTSRHYKINEIISRHWLQTAKLTKFSQDKMEGIIHEVLESTDNVINNVSRELPADFPQELSDSIFAGMQANAKRLGK